VALWTTERVAEELAMSPEWVRDNAADLGGIRMGRTSRAQLRFDPEDIAAYKRRQRLAGTPDASKKSQRPRRRTIPAGVELFQPSSSL
jgi:hypothetical protein